MSLRSLRIPVRGDSLFLAYNAHMMLSDFEDGVFLRSIK
jgi:hypothetical protein